MSHQYEYYFKLREPGPGCQPSAGLISVHPGRIEFEGYSWHGYAVYDRTLEDDEITRFDIYSEFEIWEWQFQAKKQAFNHIIGRLKTAVQIEKEDGRYCIVHPATQEKYLGQWQISFFDEKGPSGHAVAKDKKEIVSTLIDYGYKPDVYKYAESEVA